MILGYFKDKVPDAINSVLVGLKSFIKEVPLQQDESFAGLLLFERNVQINEDQETSAVFLARITYKADKVTISRTYDTYCLSYLQSPAVIAEIKKIGLQNPQQIINLIKV